MVFKKMMRAFGAGGPTVDTVLHNPGTQPGQLLQGQVDIVGGDYEVTIEDVVVSLVTGVEAIGIVEFHRVAVAGTFKLAAKESRSLPFSFPMPWETPVTAVYGRRLHGMTMGLRTGLAVAKAVDNSDLDEVLVHPLPVQEKILTAFADLGFRFARADLERGQIYGVRQSLPFYQEIEFYPAPQYAGAINEVELTFVADPGGVEVILEFDKRGGFMAPSQDTYGRFRIGHDEAESADWAAVVDGWVRQATDQYSAMRSAHGGYGGGHGGYGGGHGGYGGGHGQHGGRGMGAGAVAAGVAGGVVGGMLIGEAMDGMFEDEGDDGGE